LYYYAAGSQYDYFAKTVMEWRDYQYDFRRREPVIFGVALCVADEVNVPFTDKPLPFAKY